MDLCHCRPTFFKSTHTQLLLSTTVTPHNQQKTRFHRVTTQKPVCSLCSEWRFDAQWFFKQVYADSQRACLLQSLTLNTRGKKHCSKMTGCSPKNTTFPFKRKSTQNTQVYTLDVHSAHHFDGYLFSCICLVPRSWALDALYLPNFDMFPCQQDVYNRSGLQMKAD